jgi:hypothetical protein
METRSTRSHIRFRQPFTLPGLAGPQPAGRYVIHTEQEMLDTVTFMGWRQTALTIEIAQDGATEHVTIDAQALREALVRDGDQSTDPPAPPTAAAGREERRPSRPGGAWPSALGRATIQRRPRNLMRSGGRS